MSDDSAIVTDEIPESPLAPIAELLQALTESVAEISATVDSMSDYIIALDVRCQELEQDINDLRAELYQESELQTGARIIEQARRNSQRSYGELMAQRRELLARKNPTD